KEHLLENSDEIPNDLLLQALGEPAPDAFRWSGHKASHSFTRERRSSRAALVSLVRGSAGALGARLVASTGIRRHTPSRWATKTWPGLPGGWVMDKTW